MTPGQWRDRQRIVFERVDLLGQHSGGQGVVDYPLNQLEGRFHLVPGFGEHDLILRQPKCADKPWVARNYVDILAYLMIGIVLIASQPSDVSLDPQPVSNSFHCGLYPLVIGLEYTEIPDADEAGVYPGIVFQLKPAARLTSRSAFYVRGSGIPA